MKVLYRKYKICDLNEVHLLMEELGYIIDHSELENNVLQIQNRGGQVFIAENNKKVIGIVCVIIDIRLAEGVYAEIVSLVVGTDARGMGIGKELVNTAEKWAANHVNRIRIRANVVREEAHAFYEALGYESVKKQNIYRKMVRPGA